MSLEVRHNSQRENGGGYVSLHVRYTEAIKPVIANLTRRVGRPFLESAQGERIQVAIEYEPFTWSISDNSSQYVGYSFTGLYLLNLNAGCVVQYRLDCLSNFGRIARRRFGS